LVRDAEDRYLAAEARRRQAVAEWEAEGRPLTLVYPNRMVGVHPLFKGVELTAEHAERMSRPFTRSRWFVPRIEPGDGEGSRTRSLNLVPTPKPSRLHPKSSVNRAS
jgi:hypothetical protein